MHADTKYIYKTRCLQTTSSVSLPVLAMSQDVSLLTCMCAPLSPLGMVYRKFPKYSDTQKICCNHSKILTMRLYHSVMIPNDVDGMANSVDPDQTSPV